MLECIKEIDKFGYTPQFLISGGTQFKSKLGGSIFVVYLLFAIYYFVNQISSFVKNRINVDSSRDSLKYSGNFNLSSSELYFGLGLVNSRISEFNLSDFPYFKISLYFYTNKMDGTKIKIPVNLTTCDLKYFLDGDRNSIYSDEELANLKNKSLYYLCIDPNFVTPLDTYEFGGEEDYLQINLDLTNTTILQQAKNQIFDQAPYFNYIFKDVLVETEDKINPFSSYINSFASTINYEFSTKLDLLLNSFEMLDDDNMFSQPFFSPIITNSSNHTNGTIFQTSVLRNDFSFINDRTLYSLNNTKEPEMNLVKIRIYLNHIMRLTFRSYKKFSILIAEITSILSNILLIITIIMIRYNSVQGMNNMIMSIFSNESIKNLKLFKQDFTKTYGESKNVRIPHSNKCKIVFNFS